MLVWAFPSLLFTDYESSWLKWVSCTQDTFRLSGKVSACNAGAVTDASSISGSGRSPGGELATHSSILAWGIPVDRGAWWAHSPWGGKELDTTVQANNSRHIFLTETLKILQIDEKTLSLNKAKQKAQTVIKHLDCRAELKKVLGNKSLPTVV